MTIAEGSLNRDVLRQAAEALRGDLGDLSDLPLELANTLANVYYRFFACAEHTTRGGNTNLLKPYLDESRSPCDAFKYFSKFNAETLASFEFAKNFVQSVRGIKKKKPELFSYMTTLTLDILKYKIDNADSKTPIRRAIERRFKTPREIPDLLERMYRGSDQLLSVDGRPPVPDTSAVKSPVRGFTCGSAAIFFLRDVPSIDRRTTIPKVVLSSLNGKTAGVVVVCAQRVFTGKPPYLTIAASNPEWAVLDGPTERFFEDDDFFLRTAIWQIRQLQGLTNQPVVEIDLKNRSPIGVFDK